MPNREWITTDYYAVLGVPRSATVEEITERYRLRVWELHPDRNPGDAQAEAEFKQLARAYAVLATPERRAAYDATRDAVFDRGFDPAPGSTRLSVVPRRASGFRLNPRVAFFGGVACLIVGVLVSALVLSVTSREAAIRADGVPVTAMVVQVQPEALVQFTTEEGTTETVSAPRVRDRRNGGYRLGEALPVRYLRADPTRIAVEESTTARDVTMWIIAVKLLVCGVVLLGFGLRGRRADPQSPGERFPVESVTLPILAEVRNPGIASGEN